MAKTAFIASCSKKVSALSGDTNVIAVSPAVMSVISPPNTLNRQFDVVEPDLAWVTDFTYIRTHEGWLYLTVVIDLFSR